MPIYFQIVQHLDLIQGMDSTCPQIFMVFLFSHYVIPNYSVDTILSILTRPIYCPESLVQINITKPAGKDPTTCIQASCQGHDRLQENEGKQQFREVSGLITLYLVPFWRRKGHTCAEGSSDYNSQKRQHLIELQFPIQQKPRMRRTSFPRHTWIPFKKLGMP